MLLYLDDDSVDGAVIRRLAADGHDLLTPRAAGTAGHADPVHFMCAIRAGRVLFTHDHEDFTLLHDLVLLAGGHHPGILVIRLARQRSHSGHVAWCNYPCYPQSDGLTPRNSRCGSRPQPLALEGDQLSPFKLFRKESPFSPR